MYVPECLYLLKAPQLSSPYCFSLAECIFALDQNNPRDQLQPLTTSHYRKSLRGKWHSLVSSKYVRACPMERLSLETPLGHISAEELWVILLQMQLQFFNGNSFFLYVTGLIHTELFLSLTVHLSRYIVHIQMHTYCTD